MHQVIWKILYKTSSGVNGGTLFQLRNLTKRRAVTKTIKSDPTACEDFLLLVVEAHILKLMMNQFGLHSIDDTPGSDHDIFGTQFIE
jgi:hypothetical protein